MVGPQPGTVAATYSEVSDPFFCVENSETCLVNDGGISSEEKIKINNLLRHIHSVTGHGSVETLIKSSPSRTGEFLRKFWR